MYIYVYIYIRTYVYICLYIHMYICIYMFIYTYVRMFIYVYIPATAPSHVGWIHVGVQVCMRIHIYICLHVFTCMGIHIYICMYMLIYLQPLHRVLENGNGLRLVVWRKENFSKVRSTVILYILNWAASWLSRISTEREDGLRLIVLRKENFAKVRSIVILFTTLSSELERWGAGVEYHFQQISWNLRPIVNGT